VTDVNLDSIILQDTRNFLVQYLRDSGYTGSVEDGTAIHDTVIKPMALLLEVFKQQTAKAKAYLSLAEAEALKETLGDEYDPIVDSILSNWFVERKPGTYPKIKARLFFAQAPNVLKIAVGETILTMGGVKFSPDEAVQKFSTDFVTHYNPFGGVDKYSVDVVLTADATIALNSTSLNAGATFGISSLYFLGGEVLSEVSTGTTQEPSDAFIARAKQAITTRELITSRAITTVLIDDIDEVTTVYVAGHGSPEQMRDIHTFQGVTVHTGNKADIYVKSGIELATLPMVVSSGNQISLVGSDVLQVMSVKSTVDAMLVNRTFSVLGNSETLANSLSNTRSLYIPEGTVGETVQVTSIRSMGISQPTNFLTHENNRVGCYDPLIKEMFPVVISGTIVVEITDVSLLSKVQATIVDFINALGTSDVFKVSTLIARIHATHPEVTQVKTPVTLTYSVQNPKDLNVVVGTLTSSYVLPTGLSQQVSLNTTQFFTASSLITVVSL